MLVVGAGALGNEVLKNLALLGVGTVYLIDLDAVEPSNLSRSVLFRAEDGGQGKAEVAARRAREINPDVAIVAMRGDVITDLGLGLFADVDVVIGCLDNREARLWVNRQCWKVGHPLGRRGDPGDPGGRQGVRPPRLGLLRMRDDRARLSAPEPAL